MSDKNDIVLLVNLGSPNLPTVPDLKRYLRQFLMDGRVIDIPAPIRWFLVNFIIVPFRAAKSAEAYNEIWTPQGSPLAVHTETVRALLDARLEVPVVTAMRYGEPSIRSVLEKWFGKGSQRAIVVPLYPHYAMSSYETAVEEVRECARRLGVEEKLSIIQPFYDDPDYLDALVQSAQPALQQPYDHLLFSYHGVPERHIHKGDPTGSHCLKTPDCCDTPSEAHAVCYRHQVFRTTAEFVKSVGIPPEKYSVAFQSRLGKDPWLAPNAAEVIAEFPSKGVKKLAVICPSFVSDCLETLEEIGLRGKETFLEAGGESFTLVPCLNDHPRWIEALEGWCGKEIG